MKTTACGRSARRAFGLLAFSLLLSACALGPPSGVRPVDHFVLERYLGTWYEMARLENRFERGMTDVSASYRRRAEGGVRVLNRGYDPEQGVWRQAEGIAWPIGASDVGALKVSFFGPFYAGYHVLDVDPEYRWAVVVGADRDYAWILAREKTITPELRERLSATLAAAGVDSTALVWVTHRRSDPALTRDDRPRPTAD